MLPLRCLISPRLERARCRVVEAEGRPKTKHDASDHPLQRARYIQNNQIGSMSLPIATELMATRTADIVFGGGAESIAKCGRHRAASAAGERTKCALSPVSQRIRVFGALGADRGPAG